MKYKQFYSYLLEYNEDDAMEAFYESYDNQLRDILEEFVSGRKHVSWRTIPAARLIKVWNDFGKMEIVRDDKAMLMFKKILLNNIVRLTITTELSAHSEKSPENIIEEAGFEDQIDLSDPDVEYKFYYVFLSDEESGGSLLSDYGLKPLQQLWVPIYNERSSDKLIYLIDKALNVIHQRSDLAAMFVEGGTSTLLKAGGYHHEND